ncbi:hypothetical protein BDZ89DRAFT_1146736 [Hymenopellis radicata]|nr:hypothetical protein BDZ89DRAFT_1146736 [Hymenopellis radicata]
MATPLITSGNKIVLWLIDSDSDVSSEPSDSDYDTAAENLGEDDLSDEYPDPEVDRLIRAFQDSDMFKPQCPAPAASQSNASTRDTLYGVRRRDGAISTTADWSQAATSILKDGAAVKAIKKRFKRRTSGVSPDKPLVVFAGKVPGVYPTWNTAKPSIKGVSGAIFMRYSTAARGQNAFQYALHKGWSLRGG